MKIIVGLGNPGKQYEQTRHNVGFMLANALAKEWGATFLEKPKFKAFVAEAAFENEKVLLIKPTTFYNLVGESVRAVRDFYKCDNSDILVIHDDMALPFGTIRTRFSGSDAGNNGIKSLNLHLGEGYARMRVGVWDAQREHIDATNFVLGRFSKENQDIIETKLIPAAKEIAKAHTNNTLEAHSIKLVGVAKPENVLEEKRDQTDNGNADDKQHRL